MLLQDSLTDKDIPRRDKLREAIIQQFYKEFETLKVELSVGRTPILLNLLLIYLITGLPWTYQSNSRHLVESEPAVLPRRHSTLDWSQEFEARFEGCVDWLSPTQEETHR
jgi:hypothetical protein